MSFVKTAFDIARKKVYFCEVSDNIAEVAKKLHTNNIGSIIVKDDDLIKGIITVNDLLRQMEKNRDPYKTKAQDVMSSPVIMVNKDMEIDELVDVFNQHQVSRMVLRDDKNKVVGVVRDIAVYKYMTFYKFDKDARKRFATDYLRELY